MSTRLYVYANSGKPVLAEYLEIDGRVIRDPSGNPYKVPADFDWNTYMGKFEKLKHSLEAMEKAERILPDEGIPAIRDAAVVYGFLYAQFHAAWPASPSDIQRTYNGYIGKGPGDGDFVPDFTAAASFLYGAACAASGLSQEECLGGGGAQNILSSTKARIKGQAGSIDTSGKYYNAPKNIPHIENGWNTYTNGVAGSEGTSKKGKTYTDQSHRPAPVPAYKPPVPSSPVKPHSSLEAPSSPYRPASLDMGTLGPAEPMAGRNKFLSPDMSQGFPAQFADPFAQYADRGFSPVTENPYVPGQGGPARPNLLDSPSSFDSPAFGTGTPPLEVIAQPSGRARREKSG